MPWAVETKMGFAWGIVIVILFLIAIWAMVVLGNIAPIALPIVAYIVFLAWVNRVK